MPETEGGDIVVVSAILGLTALGIVALVKGETVLGLSAIIAAILSLGLRRSHKKIKEGIDVLKGFNKTP